MPQPKSIQLQLSDEDKQRLCRQIEDDYNNDSADLEARNQAMRRWYRMWRNAMGPNGFPEEERSNFSIPLATWAIKAKIAKELDILLGEESEIVVNPVGPTDVDRVEKVRRWMNWRIKNSLKLYKKLYIHILQKNIFGTSIAFLPWCTKTRKVKNLETVQVPTQMVDQMMGLPYIVDVPTVQEVEKDVVYFDGPDLQIENLEDWIVPAKVTNILESHFQRRLYLTIDELLDLRDQGKLDGAILADSLDDLRRLAEEGTSNPANELNNAVTQEKDDQKGTPSVPQGAINKLVVNNWFGKFRMNVGDDGSGGDERSTDVVAFWQKDKKLLLGVCRLVDIFPNGRIPFIVSQCVMDVNNPWGIGTCEQVEPISNEMDVLHRIATDAGEGAIGPVIFYEPGSGFDPEKHKIEPYTAIPTSNAAGVKAVNLGQINLAPYVLLMNKLESYQERMTSLTDNQLGRQSDRPNAPRTYGQQALLQGESNVNLLLDIRLERENLREMLQMVWDMDKRWLPKPVFFRVTESDADEVMTQEDMEGEYDFDIGPVTAISNRAQKMQELMQAFAIFQQLNIPPVTIALGKKLLQKLGQQDVAAMLPDMEQMRPPMSALDENTRLLQGENPDPHPMDNHAQHIAEHEDLIRRIQESELAPGITMEIMNPQAVGRIQAHVAKHQQVAAQGVAGAIANLLPQIAQSGNGKPPQPPAQVPNPFESAQGANSAMRNMGPLNLG